MSSSSDLSDAERERVAELVTMVNRLERKVETQAERIDDLEQEVQTQDAKIDAYKKQINAVKTVIAGDPTEFSSWDVENIDPVIRRLIGVEDAVAEIKDKREVILAQDGGTSTPDQRAAHLRQVLYNQAKQNAGKARLDRDGAESALGGGLHRQTVLDAMRRAADGAAADVNGSSDLQPVTGVEFTAGKKRDTQSTVALNLTETTAEDLRQNLTTKTTDEGGEE